MVPISGRLLVASPMLGDPNFARTVVLMLAHDDEGALGLVLNRPSEVDVGTVLPDVWRDVAPRPQVLFVGGPVAPDSVIGLARVAGEGEGYVPMSAGLATVDLERTPESIGRRRLGRRGSSPAMPDGARGSSRASSRCPAGSSSTPTTATRSPTTLTGCGERCSGVNRGASGGSRTSLTR